MSSKIDLLISSLNLVPEIPPEFRKLVIDKFVELSEEEKQDKASVRAKKRGKELIVVLTSEKEIDLSDVTASVWQTPNGYSAGSLLDDVRAAAVDQNLCAKKNRNLLKTFGDIICSLKPKWLKEKNIKKLNKEGLAVLQAPVNFITD